MPGKVNDLLKRWFLVLGEIRFCMPSTVYIRTPFTICIILWLLPPAQAAGNWNQEDASGKVTVYGSLVESACRLEAKSAFQAIELGETGTGRLKKIGDRGTPVSFELNLEDCPYSFSAVPDDRTNTRSWAHDQPIVTVRFSAVRDPENPELIKVQGASGVGLRMQDVNGENVRLGSRGKPLYIKPGATSLVYSVIPERTSANLIAGSYYAVMDFHLSYD